MIDIIIPVYNTPINDLFRCLESIYNQTFKDYRVIIIDDGSIKKIRDFLDKYIENKDNFVIKHTNNYGVSHARNEGISMIESKYVTFVDTDDTITENFLKESYEIMENHDLDLLVGGYNEIKDGKIVRVRKCENGFYLYEKDKLIYYFEKLLTAKTNENNKELSDTPTGRIYTKLYKSSLIKNNRFNENISISEDTLYLIDLMKDINKIGVISKVWYNYYINDYSISRKKLDKEEIQKREDFIDEIEVRKNNNKIKKLDYAFSERIRKTRSSYKI